MSAKSEMKEGEFDPGCVTDIYDKINGHNYALRALGALLQSSDLYAFSDEGLASRLIVNKDKDASNLRWGISQIIELCIDHQENILSEYSDLYHKSDICIIKHAKTAITMTEQGAWTTREEVANNLNEEITRLNTVINRDGELKDKAVVLKETCLKYIGRLKGKEAVSV